MSHLSKISQKYQEGFKKQVQMPSEPLDLSESSSYREKLFTIPSYITEKYMPSPNLPILQFIYLPLPAVNHSFVLSQIDIWFSSDTPITNLSELFTPSRQIPSISFLTQLANAFDKQWVNGSQSIIDPQTNEGGDRFPPAAILVWTQLYHISVSQKQWKTAYSSIQDIGVFSSQDIALCKLGVRVLHSLNSLGWNQPLAKSDKRHHKSLLLLPLLSESDWFTDDAIDILLEEINYRFKNLHPLKSSSVRIANTFFTSFISQAYQVQHPNDNGYKTPEPIALLEEEICQGGITEMYFPIHTNNNHWVAGMIDFLHAEVRYGWCYIDLCFFLKNPTKTNTILLIGDSLSGRIPPPIAELGAIQRWVKLLTKQNLVNSGNSLECGNQNNTYDCGICLVNTISHALIGDSLYVTRLSRHIRLQWFLRVIEPHRSLIWDDELIFDADGVR
jgi:hypothetical protein